MEQQLQYLRDKLKELDDKIEEVKKRMPVHSVKPPIMIELFALEDERNALEKQIIQLKEDKDE
jgi:chromosome segregation ATPase